MTIDPALTRRWITRRSVPPLHEVTREPLPKGCELRVHRGRIAAMRPEGTARAAGPPVEWVTELEGGALGPGLVDPHRHVEDGMMPSAPRRGR